MRATLDLRPEPFGERVQGDPAIAGPDPAEEEGRDELGHAQDKTDVDVPDDPSIHDTPPINRHGYIKAIPAEKESGDHRRRADELPPEPSKAGTATHRDIMRDILIFSTLPR
jgi:hypothetical protein